MRSDGLHKARLFVHQRCNERTTGNIDTLDKLGKSVVEGLAVMRGWVRQHGINGVHGNIVHRNCAADVQSEA